MVEKPFDLDANHPLVPHKEVIAEYEKVKFDYEPTIHDRAYKRFHELVHGRATSMEVSQIYRIRIVNKGEFLCYDATYKGKDWKDNDCDFYTHEGKYEKPIFRREKDPATQQVTSTEITSHTTIYDIPFTKEKLAELLQSASERISLAVQDGYNNRMWGIQSLEDFKEGSIDELVLSAKSGKSLDAVRAEKGQFTYEKRERKETSKN